MLHEIAAEHFGLDTKVARTLAVLARHPGRLTVEFLQGRRVRYLPPLRLYLSLSVIYFLVAALFANGVTTKGGVGIIRVSSPAKKPRTGGVLDTSVVARESGPTRSSAGSLTPGEMDRFIPDTIHGNPITLYFKRRFDRRLEFFKSHQTEAVRQISDAFQSHLPDALFLLVPGLALALLLLYHGSGRYYGEHLVFALHFQAFSFAALTVGLLPVPLLDTLTGIAIVVYLFMALRTVYGQGTAVTAGKLGVIIVGYGVSLMIIMSAVALTAFLFS